MNFIHCPKPAPRPEERWTSVHIEPPREEESSSDTFEQVSEIEQLTIAFLKTNLNGKPIMINSIATALNIAKATKAPRVRKAKVIELPPSPGVAAHFSLADADTRKKMMAPAPAPVSYHNYFDPIDALEDHLGKYPVVHAKVLNSAAWMLDMACINAARNVLFTRYIESERVEGEASKLNEFSLGIVEMISHDSLYQDETPEHNLAMLLALRNQWHDATASATAAHNKDYNPKSFDELLLSEKPRLADVGTRANFKIIANAEAAGNAVMEANLLEAFIKGDELNAIARAEDNRKLIPTLSVILSTVARYAPADTRFDHLPVDTQRRLTDQIRKSFDRIKIDMAKTLAREPIMFGHVYHASKMCVAALDAIMSTKYSQATELEYAGLAPVEANHQRRQRDIARVMA